MALSLAFVAACSGSPNLELDDDSTNQAAGTETSGSPGDGPPPDGPAPPDNTSELTPENDTFADRIVDAVAQIDGSGTKAQIVALDQDGVAIGVLVTWIDQNGATNLEANFQDGYLAALHWPSVNGGA